MKRLLLIAVLGTFSVRTFSQTQPDSLDIMIGQMIMVGIGDFNFLNKEERIFQEIEVGLCGGIILFEKNLSMDNPRKRVSEIVQYAQSKSKIPLLISIDEEGGRVNRLKPRYGFPKTVSAQYLGQLDQEDSTFKYAFRTAQTLHSLGINVNFAPTVDVNINPENPVIGRVGRSYSADAQRVSRHAGIVVRAHDSLGITTVLKHFPGHGSSTSDTHLGIADVTSSWKFEELFPYENLMDQGQVRAIMTAHIVNGYLDDSKVPATLSPKIINGILRGFMNYEGVVFSDDMQMWAISKEYGMHDALRMSLNAGVDVVLFGNNVPENDFKTASELHAHIRDLVETGEVPLTRIKESYGRIIKLKSEMGFFEPDFRAQLNARLNQNQ